MKTIIASIVPKLPPLPWTPTGYVLNDQTPVPKSPALPVTVIPIDPMVKGRPGVLQNNWRLVMNADALFLDKRDDHLYTCARRYGLTIYAPLYDQKDDEDLFASQLGIYPEPEADLFGTAAAPVTVSEDADLFGADDSTDLFATDEPDLFS